LLLRGRLLLVARLLTLALVALLSLVGGWFMLASAVVALARQRPRGSHRRADRRGRRGDLRGVLHVLERFLVLVRARLLAGIAVLGGSAAAPVARLGTSPLRFVAVGHQYSITS
jgi:hypothetical protein